MTEQCDQGVEKRAEEAGWHGLRKSMVIVVLDLHACGERLILVASMQATTTTMKLHTWAAERRQMAPSCCKLKTTTLVVLWFV